MRNTESPAPKGRGAASNPGNRFEACHFSHELEAVADDEDYLTALGRPKTEWIPDRSRSIVTDNRSEDVGFESSINVYRGCEHGCIYCYARPTHEFLGYSAGLDFETKILVKHDAPKLLRRIERAVGRKIHFGTAACPAEGIEASHLIELAGRRLQASIRKSGG